jgi:hypothetical protein
MANIKGGSVNVGWMWLRVPSTCTSVLPLKRVDIVFPLLACVPPSFPAATSLSLSLAPCVNLLLFLRDNYLLYTCDTPFFFYFASRTLRVCVCVCVAVAPHSLFVPLVAPPRWTKERKQRKKNMHVLQVRFCVLRNSCNKHERMSSGAKAKNKNSVKTLSMLSCLDAVPLPSHPSLFLHVPLHPFFSLSLTRT